MDNQTEHGTNTAQTEDVNVAGEPSNVFADGDLGRIQGILFGDHARKVDERLASLEEALLGAIADLRSELQSSVQVLEKRVASEETTRSKALKNMGDRLETEAEVRVEGEASINHKIDSTETAIRNAIAFERSAAAADVDREFSSLRSNSVDRRDLAELFAATAEQLRGEE